MMLSSLRTARLRLDAFTAGDAVELHELFADPDTHTIGSGPFTAFKQTERWIAHRLAAQREHGLCWYALRSSETGRLIGNCGMLAGRTGFEEPEIGYLIQASQRGRGYAGEAAGAVLEQCRAARLTRVWASIRPHNHVSRRIATGLGMHVDRTERDERGDLLFYVINL
ncbi:GNAT family N-acetyltransferase [Paractinoplanes lichenicola]|uniref:GNAT family N-acetyltransferase n=1 Tax=Paractinoplanes lichenicola TaxID=2802976 RepID=A0ABS1VN09_9ACTN|nr:GNAT family N-acetyltransferase [Actinoplanes lichenicola]MBL7255861.1 GNAT family N-acetyltransferase [Actinoplanes lichenicola]